MLALVLKRYVRRTSQLGSVSIVVCIFVAIIASVFATSNSIQNTAVAHELAGAQLTQANLTATFDGDLATTPQDSLDRQVRSSLARLGVDNPMFFVTYRPISNAIGQTFQLVGVDEKYLTRAGMSASSWCDPNDCAISLLSGSDIALPHVFNKLGPAEINTSAISDLTIQDGVSVYVTSDIQGLLAFPSITDLSRTLVWTAPVNEEHLAQFGPQKSLAEMREISNQFSLYSAHLILHFPEQPIAQAVAQSQSATQRLNRMLALCAFLFAAVVIFLSGNARESHQQVSAVWNQIRGSSAAPLAWLSAGVSVLPGLLIAVAWIFISPAAAGFMFGFALVAGILVAVVLSGNMRLAVIALTLVATSAAIKTQEPGLVATLVAVVVAVLAQRVLTRTWTKPLSLATSRRPETTRNSLLIAVCTAVITSWLVTAHALDQQESQHITYVSPLQSAVSGFTTGVFQNNSLDDFRKFGNVFPIETIPATSSGRGYSVENVQLVGLPNQADLSNVSDIGGPTQAQLQQLLDDNQALPILGLDQPLVVQHVPARMELGVWVLDANNESRRMSSSSVISSHTRILGVEISQTSKDLERSQHAVGEGKHAIALPSGLVSFEFPGGQKVNTNIRLTSGSIYFPAQIHTTPLRAIVSNGLAKVGDSLVVNITAEQPIQLQVVGVATIFPNAPQKFAVVDQAALNNYLASTRPEMIRSTQLWIAGNVPTQSNKFAGLKVVNRNQLHQEFLSDATRLKTRELYYGVSGILIVLVLFFARSGSRTIRKNSRILEWSGRGSSPAFVHQSITRVLSAIFSIHIVLAVALSYLVTSILVSSETVTWAGLDAIPSVMAQFSWPLLGMIFLVLLATSLVGVYSGRSRHDN